jgi:serine/threonine protein kinase
MTELAEGVVVAGRFRLIKKLGQGGMGSVWLATHLGLDTKCAIKFVEGAGAMLPEMHARFEREAKAAASLHSPHVVQIIDHAIWDGVPFMAMELLDGEDLRHRLDAGGRLTPAQTVDILRQVCRALNKAHNAGIVHRDLKPDNIYLVRDDDREIAKVLDFGIAKSKAALESGSNTKTGAMLGTPYYMSPEQAQGIKTVDFRSDLWSMAVIAYECITGVLPFQSEALGDLLMRIMVAPVPVPSEVTPVPPGFDAWWAKAATRDPAGRFQSAKEFIDTLAIAAGVSAGVAPSVSTGSGVHQLQSPMSGTLPFAALTPNPAAHTPNPAAPPVAHTFGGAPPAKNMALQAIVAAGAAFLVIGVIAFAAFSVRAKGKAESAAKDVASSASNKVSATSPVVEPPAPSVVATLEPAPSVAPIASAVPASSAVSVASSAHRPASSAKTPVPTNRPPTTPVASANTPPPVNKRDLGF